MIDPGLEGRVALVTGANQGIGAAIARTLGAQGASVLCAYLRLDPSERAEDPGTPADYGPRRARDASEVIGAIEADGGRAVAFEADLSDPDAVRAIFDRAEEVLGPVEILVNNADVSSMDTFSGRAVDRIGRTLDPLTAETHERHFAVNARAVALGIAEFARRCRERGGRWGRIVTLTSGGRDGFPEEISYGASKAAGESYTYSAAWELGELGVTANVVMPPPTDTGWISDEARDAVAAANPLGRIAAPEDVASAVLLLCSEGAAWITGQRIALH